MNRTPDQLIVMLVALLLSAGLIVGGFTYLFKGQFGEGLIAILAGLGIAYWLYRRVG